jgi:hypothetical protein
MSYPGPYLTLCTTQEQYIQVFEKCKVVPVSDWITTPHADATTHHLHNPEGDAVCVICMRVQPNHTSIEIAGLLVHEAVHVVQDYFVRIGEHSPATEQYAYAVQNISQELMNAYAESLN